MLGFDLIFPAKNADLSAFLLAAKEKKIASLGVLSIGNEPFSGELSILSADRKENVFCFFRFPYENRVWDLSQADELFALASEMNSTNEGFLLTYRSVCKAALEKSNCGFAFGLEAVGAHLDELCFSPIYRKTMLDLTDRLFHNEMALGYAERHPIFDLSPCVLRRTGERRGDLLPASFAKTPCEVGKGVKNTLLSARSAGVGSFVTYENSGWERHPIAPNKEVL